MPHFPVILVAIVLRSGVVVVWLPRCATRVDAPRTADPHHVLGLDVAANVAWSAAVMVLALTAG